MPTLNISVSFEVPSGQREQAKIMAGLNDSATAFEAEIAKVSDEKAEFVMRIVRHKEKPAPTPALRAAE
jgi:hypothetical protein